MSSAAVINTFLGHIFTGRMDEALALVAPDARFIPSRPEPTAAVPLFGTFVGPEGARRVFTTFAEVLEPGRFDLWITPLDGPPRKLVEKVVLNDAGPQWTSDGRVPKMPKSGTMPMCCEPVRSASSAM